MALLRLADYVLEKLAQQGCRHAFMVTGGGAMHLNDAFALARDLEVICCHHEQSCAMAAEAYARVTNRPAILNVTCGPGGINALNGVFGAFTDSLPMIVLSGQVKRETLLQTYGITGILRQLGDQEVDIVHMVRHITKYAVLVNDPSTIRYHIERAYHLSTQGRPGPCWLDIPIDVQSARIDPDTLIGYDPQEDAERSDHPGDPQLLEDNCRELAARLRDAQRPIILAGSGVHLSGTQNEFLRFARKLQIPVATAWTGVDLIGSDDPLFVGRPGTVGDRAGNFCVQSADLVIVLGSRLPIRQVSYNWNSFARHAFKVQVDVDRAELEKPTMIRPDLAIHADLKDFFRVFDSISNALPEPVDASGNGEWLRWCKERRERYPIVLDRHRDLERSLNPYHFIEELFKVLSSTDIICCANASAAVMTFQAADIKPGQRLFSNAGSASMGYDLPSAIGAAVGSTGRVICLAGDGSIMMNLQELQTILEHRWPIKIFLFNNGGYLSIRATQKNFFGRAIGAGPESGVSFPDFHALAKAWGIPTVQLKNPDFAGHLPSILDAPGPALIDLALDLEQSFEPKLSSRQLPDGRMVTAQLEDMAPFLDPEELKANLWFEPTVPAN